MLPTNRKTPRIRPAVMRPLSLAFAGRILRRGARSANMAALGRLAILALCLVFGVDASAQRKKETPQVDEITGLQGVHWDFGRDTDANSNKWPDGWQRHAGVGYPLYVDIKIAPRDPEIEKQFKKLDTAFIRSWPTIRKQFPDLPASPPAFPDSMVDRMIDRFLRVELDGGQAKVQTTQVKVSRLYQYRFTCDIMTQGLRHDTAFAELVFLDETGQVVASYPTKHVGGTSDWTTVAVDRLQPPVEAVSMLARLNVQRSEEGLEDIKGVIGFDNVRIDQYPQLQVATDDPLGVYVVGQPIEATARVMGLPIGASKVRFRLYSSEHELVAQRVVSVVRPREPRNDLPASSNKESISSELSWRVPRLDPGYYRVTAALEGNDTVSLATDSTLAVVDRLVDGPPHGSFGWTLPKGNQGIDPREIAPWLAKLGVAWVKYPCWLAPTDNASAEDVATIFSKLQDSGIQTVGMLDLPPTDQVPNYNLRGRRDLVAAQLFRDIAVWQPLLEPVMTRLTLKVRTWQLGGDRDHSFLGRPRLRDSIRQISTGLQGFGQPIDVAISWPWLEEELGPGESSWQAICRSSDPPLGADELDAYLTLGETGSRAEGPRTWLLLDPASKTGYDREARIRDLVLRMATVRSHRVQAAFVSRPRDPEHGLLRPDGRPDDLLLPWRTTSRLIGNLRHVGSLQLRSGAQNQVFAGSDRAVLMVWSAEPTEEVIYLGKEVSAVDVWGRVTKLKNEQQNGQTVQRVKIGRTPTFIIGADPTLLAFRMSVALDRSSLDSLLGQVQKLGVTFTNPTRDGLAGEMAVVQPQSWTIQRGRRGWEALGGRNQTQKFNVILGNSTTIGRYEIPIRFELQTVPNKRITVYRWVNVGPEGLDLKVDTRLQAGDELRVRVEMTNRSLRTQQYDCMLFPPGERQYQRRFIKIKPGETIRTTFYWANGSELIGKRMLLRAVEQEGRRVVNYAIDVNR